MAEKEGNLPRRERRSTQRLFEELRGRGYDDAHDSVHRFVKAWRDERARVPARAFVPMSFVCSEVVDVGEQKEATILRHVVRCPLFGEFSLARGAVNSGFKAGGRRGREPAAPSRMSGGKQRRPPALGSEPNQPVGIAGSL